MTPHQKFELNRQIQKVFGVTIPSLQLATSVHFYETPAFARFTTDKLVALWIINYLAGFIPLNLFACHVGPKCRIDVREQPQDSSCLQVDKELHPPQQIDW